MLLSIVIPVYNEQESLPELLATLCPHALAVDPDYEVIFVDDGSSDATLDILEQAARANPHLRVLAFSRNFGQQAAITAGLDAAAGEAVVVMDADLQDPPDLVPEMVRLYKIGYDVVSPQRRQRADGLFKRLTAAAFYRVMQRFVDRKVHPEVGDFRLYSASALKGIRQLREQHRFLRGMVAWLGLRECIVPFDRPARRAGQTKYGLIKMLRFSWTAITSFSGFPLRAALGVGAVLMLLSLAAGAWVAYSAIVYKNTVPGWASLVVAQCVLSGAILGAIGLVGDYVARLYDEAKGRPLYVIREMINTDLRQETPRAFILPQRGPSQERWHAGSEPRELHRTNR